MELYLPSLFIVLLSGIVVFAILPRMAPLILVVLVALMLGITGFHHSSLFREEYATSTWQTSVYNSAAPFLIAMIALFSIGFGLNLLKKTVVAVAAAVPSVPQMGANTLKSLIRDPFKSNPKV
jgi:hypothetical protein